MKHPQRLMPTGFSLLSVMLLSFSSHVFSSHVSAQSTVIQVGGSVERAIQVPQAKLGQIPNSLNSQQRNWMAKLSEAYPSHFIGVDDAKGLIVKLRELGLPFELGQSAMDDSLAFDDPIEIQLQNMPLKELLYGCLDSRNAAIAMRGNRLLIISKDVANDLEFFTTISYDVSTLNGELVELNDHIRMSIAPDDWNDTGGDGSLESFYQGNRKYISISQSFETHDQIQQYLAGRLRLQGQSNMIAANRNGSSLSESQVINLPDPYELRNRGTGRGGGGFGGGGIGGYGLGGGVF